jgi:hypothetical protein
MFIFGRGAIFMGLFVFVITDALLDRFNLELPLFCQHIVQQLLSLWQQMHHQLRLWLSVNQLYFGLIAYLLPLRLLVQIIWRGLYILDTVFCLAIDELSKLRLDLRGNFLIEIQSAGLLGKGLGVVLLFVNAHHLLEETHLNNNSYEIKIRQSYHPIRKLTNLSR